MRSTPETSETLETHYITTLRTTATPIRFTMKLLLPLLAVIGLAVRANGNLCAGHSFDRPPLNIGNPRDCTLFTTCIGNVAHPRECSPGMHFSQAINNCDLEERANCVEEEIEEIPEEGPVDPNNPCSRNINFELIASAASCNEYTSCACGTPNVQRCAPGLEFDARTQVCNIATAAVCVSAVAARPTCPRQPGNLPHPNDCKHFFLCLGQGSAPQLRRCEPGLHFDRTTNMCARVPCTLAAPRGVMAAFARKEAVEEKKRVASLAAMELMVEEVSQEVVADVSEE